MRVGNLMTTNPVTCNPEMRLAEAARLMWDHDVGFLPVIHKDSQQLVGVITDRDGFMAAYTQGKPLWDIEVQSAMSRTAHACKADAQIEEAEQIMGTYKLHRVPVVEGANHVIGVLSLNDIARWAAQQGDEAIEQEVAVALGTISTPRDELQTH